MLEPKVLEPKVFEPKVFEPKVVDPSINKSENCDVSRCPRLGITAQYQLELAFC